MTKLKIGDEIIVRAGKDKGRRGKIERIFPEEGKVLVPSVNLYRKHQKGIAGVREGGIIEFSRPLPISNVSLICPQCGKQTRIGYNILRDNEKVRICRKCRKEIEKK